MLLYKKLTMCILRNKKALAEIPLVPFIAVAEFVESMHCDGKRLGKSIFNFGLPYCYVVIPLWGCLEM